MIYNCKCGHLHEVEVFGKKYCRFCFIKEFSTRRRLKPLQRLVKKKLTPYLSGENLCYKDIETYELVRRKFIRKFDRVVETRSAKNKSVKMLPMIGRLRLNRRFYVKYFLKLDKGE